LQTKFQTRAAYLSSFFFSTMSCAGQRPAARGCAHGGGFGPGRSGGRALQGPGCCTRSLGLLVVTRRQPSTGPAPRNLPPAARQPQGPVHAARQQRHRLSPVPCRPRPAGGAPPERAAAAPKGGPAPPLGRGPPGVQRLHQGSSAGRPHREAPDRKVAAAGLPCMWLKWALVCHDTKPVLI
jgi:hypothetical protein